MESLQVKQNSTAAQEADAPSKAFDWNLFKLKVYSSLYIFWANKRLRWGMLFLLVLAPLSKFVYLLFPEEGLGEYLINFGPLQIKNSIEFPYNDGWYWVYMRMYLWSIGELMAPVLSIFGIFLLFPRKYYPAYLIGLPFGYFLSQLIHRMFFVNDYPSFHNGATTTLTFSVIVVGIILFIISDNVLFKENHRKRAAEARIIGLINMPGMEWQAKEPLIKKEVKEALKYNSELFVTEDLRNTA